MKTLYRILIILIVLVLCGGVGVVIWASVADKDEMFEVTLERDGETVEELSFSAGNFLPGDVKEYAILVHGEAGSEIGFTFTANAPLEGTLWKYLDFEIVYEGQSRESSLAKMFDGDAFQFDVTMDEAPAKFLVRYKMPKEVGNEAENLESEFSLTLSAKRKN